MSESCKWEEIAEYESIRVNGPTHGGRWGGMPGVVQPSGGQRLVLGRRGPYVAFRMMPEGIEFPVPMVSSAVAKEASMSNKRRRTVAAVPAAESEAPAPVAAEVEPAPADGAPIRYGRQKKMAASDA